MKSISFDPSRRDLKLEARGLDFAHAADVFGGLTMTVPDARRDYGEDRFQTYGLLDGRLVMIAWTQRGKDRHIMSMRKCNDREQAKFGGQFG